MKKVWFLPLIVALLVACGGGGGTTPGAPATPPNPAHSTTAQNVGEILSAAAQLGTAEIKSNFGYSGYLPVSRAIAAAGKENILDLLFMIHGTEAGDKFLGKLAPDVERQLQLYVTDNRALLVPGIRVLVVDEMFWNPPHLDDSPAVLQRQLDAMKTAVDLVRMHIPQASVGITITPYASFDRPNALEFARKAIALVDWVGTDPYWYGDASTITALHAWSKSFHAVAKAANPRVETWYIAQAFRLASYDLQTFRNYIAEELTYAEGYDGVMFFGWQFASELDETSIGAKFDADTKRLYQKYLN